MKKTSRKAQADHSYLGAPEQGLFSFREPSKPTGKTLGGQGPPPKTTSTRSFIPRQALRGCLECEFTDKQVDTGREFSEYAAHAAECGASLSYVLEPDLIDTQLQIMERTCISPSRPRPSLQHTMRGCRWRQVNRSLRHALRCHRGVRSRSSMIAEPFLDMSPKSRCSLPNKELPCQALMCCLAHGLTDSS